jgi:hypothetical protein
MGWRRSLTVRAFGAPPGRGAPLEERLRYIRRLYIRPLPLEVAAVVLVAISLPPPLVWVFLGGAVFFWVTGITRLNVRIRRDRHSRAG